MSDDDQVPTKIVICQYVDSRSYLRLAEFALVEGEVKVTILSDDARGYIEGICEHGARRPHDVNVPMANAEEFMRALPESFYNTSYVYAVVEA